MSLDGFGIWVLNLPLSFLAVQEKRKNDQNDLKENQAFNWHENLKRIDCNVFIMLHEQCFHNGLNMANSFTDALSDIAISSGSYDKVQVCIF